MRSELAFSDEVIEKICAYVDREAGRDAPLSVEDEAMVRELLATDPDAQTIADDLRATNAGLDALLSDVADIEIPEGLVEMIRSHGKDEIEREGERATKNVVPFRFPAAPIRHRSYGPLAAAASVAALLLGGASFTFTNRTKRCEKPLQRFRLSASRWKVRSAVYELRPVVWPISSPSQPVS